MALAEPASVEIAPFEERHLPEAAALYNHYVRNATATLEETPVSPEAFRDMVFFRDPRHGSFALLEGGVLCGFASLHPYHPRSAYRLTAEISIYLRPESAGKGIGSRVMDFLEGRARECGFHTLIAVITAENGASRALFARKGYLPAAMFREVGFKFGRWLDVVCLQKLLS